jgi:hypothetical protein
VAQSYKNHLQQFVNLIERLKEEESLITEGTIGAVANLAASTGVNQTIQANAKKPGTTLLVNMLTFIQ